ncbi:DUF3530 family protein [Alteromonas lipolytica]|uniref:DUF3530 domain-containing protein n=1 Tax=Alteromonas lipolytica TaxID=1856405 RepID=A0A1E8FFY2_9ALTE|nr:DUF3530 family protein [Alteromonas lipolytica]OFI34498.1 hypothetical protein BFC17_17845 [Alteromonas lipolytica]
MRQSLYIARNVVFTCLLLGQAYCAQALTLDDFSYYFHDEDLLSLTVADQQIPALEIQPQLPLARGTAIILVSLQSQSVNLDTGLVLGDSLAEKGWRTLLIPTDFTQAQATQTPPPASDKPIANLLTAPVDYDAYRLQIIGLINAAYSHANQYKGYTFVVAEGMTAAVLLDALHNSLLNPPDTLVSVGAFWPARTQNNALADMLAQSGYPVLDISLPTLSQWQSATVDKRRKAVAVSLKQLYRQRSFTAQQSYGGAGDRLPRPGSAWLGTEIYSWLRYLGW